MLVRKNFDLPVETIEKLQELKTLTGKSMNQLATEAIDTYYVELKK